MCAANRAVEAVEKLFWEGRARSGKAYLVASASIFEKLTICQEGMSKLDQAWATRVLARADAAWQKVAGVMVGTLPSAGEKAIPHKRRMIQEAATRVSCDLPSLPSPSFAAD